MTVEISSLRVSAQLDASQYAAGAAQKVAADQAMSASSQGVGNAITQTETKISQSGDVLARLSRQYVDGYAAAQRFNSALMQLSSGLERGKISAEQTGPILDGIFRKYGLMGDAAQFAARGQNELAAAITNANAKLAQQRQISPSNQNQNQGGLARFGSLNATSQFQDIAVTAAMGQSPFTIALQQGTQLGMALEQQLGDQGVKGLVKGLGAAFMGLLTPINLIAIGLTGVVAVAIQFGSKLLPQVKSLKDATEDQRKAVNDLADAYGMASLKADDFYKKSVIASESEARRANAELQKASGVANVGAFSDLVNPFAAGQGFITARDQFSAFNEPIQKIVKEAHNGRPDFEAFEKSIAGVVAQNPGLQTTADKILKIVAEATAAAAQLNNTANVIKDLNRSSVGNFDRTQQAGRDQSVMSQRFGDDPFAKEREQQRQKVISLNEAQDQRNRSLDQTLKLARLDVDLVGKTTTEIEGLRMAAQLEAQVREEAAKNNVKADEAEIANIKRKAAEYAKLKAQQEAADTIHTQEIDLETQRNELATVGQNTLARNASAAALKTEQEIRKLGTGITAEQTAALRANTAAQSANAEALAHATMQADLLFQRRQILRNSEDQQIASSLHSAGFPDDLNSTEAQMMRYNMALQESKDTFKGFFTDMFSGLREGKSLWESFSGAAVNALSKIADKLIDRGLDGIFNNLFGGQSPSGGANPGGLLGSLFGGSGAANQNGTGAGGILGSLFGGGSRQSSVATMQVQAATVFINGSPIGGIGGGLAGMLGGLGSPSFQPNSDLMDVLGRSGGAANQNYIQTRIDQAFGTGGSAQSMIQSRIDQAFGTTSAGFGGIFTPAGGFPSVLGSGGGMTGSMSQYASAIKMIESAGSGGYSALGPVLRNGNQALGAYQIMRSNLPSWSKDTFGSSMSQSDFMSNPSAQDAIFSKQFGKLLDKYGNSNDAASAWFTGGPLSKGAGKMDVLGTTGSQYVDKFNSALSKLGGVTDHATSAISSIGSAATSATSGLGQFGSALSQFPSAPTGGGVSTGGGFFSSLFGGLFGGGGGLSSQASAALQFNDGLYADGGFTGSGGRNQPAGIVHRGEVVWSQDDVQRAGGVHVVEGMRRGYAGYAWGGEVGARSRTGGRMQHDNDGRKETPRQTVNQTNNFIFRENPSAPASQNQIASKSAHALERLTRTA